MEIETMSASDRRRAIAGALVKRSLTVHDHPYRSINMEHNDERSRSLFLHEPYPRGTVCVGLGRRYRTTGDFGKRQ
jgi:hypothetical protein